ncbi:MAG: tyrosine-type recombinase/integrase [Verrucomicrobiota bacterium]|jgi:site-specific recombinase XerD
MIEHFFSDPKFFRRCRPGPLGPHIDGFASQLMHKGYTRYSGQGVIRIVVQLNEWLSTKGLTLQELDEHQIDAFRAYRGKRLRSHHGERGTCRLLLHTLREAHIIAEAPDETLNNPRELLVRSYARYLVRERALSQLTIGHRLPVVREFLSQRFKSKKLHLKSLRPGDVSRFVLRTMQDQGRDHAQLVTTTLRSFLDFLYQQGWLTKPLRAAVPKVANWRHLDLPGFLDPEQVERLLRSCDRSNIGGRRDYAILLLLARLGLRAHEVRGLTLDDIKWASGEVLIRGKGGREDRLPVPVDVGRAVAAYLKRGRPCCACRRVFVRLFAPYEGLTSPTIAAVVERALARAHISSTHKGAHLLRHSLATHMLRGGASLTQIGQVLRHQRTETTEIYARIDQQALRALAQPWPGGVR